MRFERVVVAVGIGYVVVATGMWASAGGGASDGAEGVSVLGAGRAEPLGSQPGASEATIRLAGSLYEGRGSPITEPSRSLQVVAEPPPDTRLAGVQVKVDGEKRLDRDCAESRCQVSWELRSDSFAPGSLEVEVLVADEGGGSTSSTFTVSRGQRDIGLRGAQIPLGRTTNEEMETLLDRLRSTWSDEAAGANTFRLPLDWSTLEPTSGSYEPALFVGGEKSDDSPPLIDAECDAARSSDSDELDHAVCHASERGIRPFIQLHASPCWARDLPTGCEINHSPEDPREFGEAAAFIANRYGERIAGIEVWNEPDLPQFLLDAGEGNEGDPEADEIRATAAARLTRAAYDAVKRVRPEMPVVTGATSGSDESFLRAMYEDSDGREGDDDVSITGKFDAIAIHPYTHRFSPDNARAGCPPAGKSDATAYRGDLPYPDRPWSCDNVDHGFVAGIQGVRDLMVEMGDGEKAIWLTELGWTTCTSYDPVTNPDGNPDWGRYRYSESTSNRCLAQGPDPVRGIEYESADQATHAAEEAQARYLGRAFEILRDRFDYVTAASVYELRNSDANDDEPDDSDNQNCSECQFGLLYRDDSDFTPKPSWNAFAEAVRQR